MIKAIIFDFFGVLVTEGFSRFTDKYFPDDKQKRKKALELVTNHDWGKLSQDEYIDGLSKLAGVSRKIVEDHMEDNLPNDTLLSYIRQYLKPRFKISVLSNSGDNYLSKILTKEDVEMFDDIVLSYQVRMVKPHSDIFELAAKRLGVKPSECLLVDDSPAHCDGAQKVGMQTIFYKDFPSFRAQLEETLPAVTDN
jgi:HAD superfamily hydrolase (TIGR01509 family)